MKPTIFALAIFCIFVGLVNSGAVGITHEDIKEALVGMVKMMRDNTDKLERHEMRDKQTTEQMKKSLATVTKRLSSIDNVNEYLVKLNERIVGLEKLIAQKEDQERAQLEKTAYTLEDLQNRLEGWATEIESKVKEALKLGPQAVDDKLNNLMSKLNDLDAKISGGVDTDTKRMQYQVDVQGDKILSVFDEVRDVCKNMKSDGDQNPTLDKVQSLLQTTIDQIRDIPKVSDMKTMHDETQMTLQEAKHSLNDAIRLGNENVEKRILDNQQESRNSLAFLRDHLSEFANRANKEMNDLNKGQSVMVEMADHVLDTKKRLEHAYKILQEIGEMVMIQGSKMNDTLNTRFDGISNDIMDNQNGALNNLTTKMEQEMSQVWRQINVMYQQMMESAKALDKLHQQNEAYVNGTTTTMDGMESKVGEITKRMSEVDTNLNYLLGRLSLVTQEFNQIKTGLGVALDNIKASFKEVQEKANDLSQPGPHPVPQDYKEMGSSREQEY